VLGFALSPNSGCKSNTIRNADRIYVVEAGIVVQSGTFDELVNQEGLFARLVARPLD
jgi:ABC-type multidrug transport system fused ATPase/permease subunit